MRRTKLLIKGLFVAVMVYGSIPFERSGAEDRVETKYNQESCSLQSSKMIE